MNRILDKINSFSLSFLTFVFLFVFTTQQANAVTETFSYTGAQQTFTVPSGKGGKYFVNVQVVSNDATAGALERLNIKVNGSEKGSGNYWKQNNNDHSLILSGIFDLSAGDTVLATYFTYAGGNSTIYSNSNYVGGTCIDIFKIAT